MQSVAPEDPFALPPLRNKGGRPFSTKPWRSEIAQFRVLSSEKARLTAAAKRAGYRDLSSWSRGMLLAACDGDSLVRWDEAARDEVARLRRDLGSGVGSNLNQALQHANTAAKGGQTVNVGELLSAVQQAQAALEVLTADLKQALQRGGRR